MRPKLLEIEGLQSFTDAQTINFEELGEAGLFGIFGPTGSGKSTILDAITFALYGKVKRAENGTQGIINTNRNTARVSFTFDLFRDGRKRTYRVERTYQRKKNSRNSCEPRIARLIEISEAGEIPLCEKATEVSGKIKELLGLNSDDFTRAVVLPQNSFHEFLFLNNSDRRDMLERIFYLEEYGKRLEEKLGRKLAKLKSRLDLLTGELMGYADASDDLLKEAEKVMETAFSERNRVETELRQLEAKYIEAREVWGLVQELDDLRRKEEQHAVGGKEIEKMRLQLEKAVKAHGLIDMIIKNRELGDRLKKTEEQLKEILDMLPGVAAGLDGMKTAYENIKKEAAMEQPRLLEKRTRLADALGTKTEIESISSRMSGIADSLSRLKNAISEKDEIIQKEKLELKKLGEYLDRLKQEAALLKVDPEYRQHLQEGAKLENEVAVRSGKLKELEDRESRLKASVAELEMRLGAVMSEIEETKKAQDELINEKQRHEAARPGDKNSLMKAMDTIRSVQGRCQVLKLLKNELDQSKSKYNALKDGLVKASQNAELLDGAVEKAGAAYNRCRAELDDAVGKINSNAAYILARSLQDGMPCPVCGSRQHPQPAAGVEEHGISELEQMVEAARKKLADAEAAFKNAEKEAIAAREQNKALAEQLEQAARDIEQKSFKYEKEKEKLPEKLKGLELEEIESRLEKAEKEYNEKMLNIEKWEIKQEEFKEREKLLNEKAARQLIAEKGISTELKVNRESLDQVRTAIAEARLAADESRKKYEGFLAQFNITDAAAEIKRIAENDKKLHLLQKESEKTAEMLESKRVELDRLNDEIRLLNADMIKLEADINGLAGQKRERETKLRELAGDVDIDDEIRLIDEKLKDYEKRENDFRSRLESLERQHNDLETKKSLLENQRNIYSESLKADEERLMSALAERGFASREEVENSVIPEDAQKEMKARIDEYDRVAVNLKAHRALLQKKLNARSITEEEWNLTNRAFLELSAYKEECVSRSEVAINNYNYLKKKHEKWVELRKAYNELDHKRGLFEQIHKLLKAEHGKDNSFIDYIAEERLRYVAANASVTLGIMTRHRYVLELDAEAGFIIRDQANGGVHRVVKSLSGGETFLTSLSLALALSEQLQFKGQSPLEFFFLDEGFGTLDQDLLDTVMDSLERLCSKQRVIGLISHVPELKNRIGRRLIVVPPGFNGEGSRVYMEKA